MDETWLSHLNGTYLAPRGHELMIHTTDTDEAQKYITGRQPPQKMTHFMILLTRKGQNEQIHRDQTVLQGREIGGNWDEKFSGCKISLGSDEHLKTKTIEVQFKILKSTELHFE